jgi:ABC-2 type transport system permease protein
VAASITFGAFLILWVIDLSARGGGTVVQEIVSYLSILNHFEDFSKGVIDTASLVVYRQLHLSGTVSHLPFH